MDQQQTPVDGTPARTEPPESAGPALRPWTVNFVVPAPEAMPSDRMKARAELVRIASGCGGNCC